MEQIEVMSLSGKDFEIYVEMDEELRQTYKRMTKEEVLADLDEPMREIDADCACLCLDGGTEMAIYWLRVSKDADGKLDWDFQLAAVIEIEPVSREEELCSQPK
jgi:hypothetical protein